MDFVFLEYVVNIRFVFLFFIDSSFFEIIKMLSQAKNVSAYMLKILLTNFLTLITINSSMVEQ